MSERYLGFTPPIPDHLAEAYEASMDGVARWQNVRYPSDVAESNLDHCESAALMHLENKTYRPQLTEGLDDEVVGGMLYVHDGGEPVTGDLARDRQDYDLLASRWKRKERLGFHIVILGQIPDPEVRDKARSLYTRYQNKDVADREANYVDLLDKLQATRFGGIHSFPGKRIKKIAEQQQKMSHVYGLIIKPAIRYATASGPYFVDEVRDYLVGEIATLGDTGYRKDIVEYYLEQADKAFTALGNS